MKKKMTTTPSEIFAGVIGQETAKERLTRSILAASADDGHIPPGMLVAPPGIGKTMMLRKFGEAVKSILNRKVLFFESGEDLGTKTSFIEDVFLPHVQNQECILLVDEAHEMRGPIKSLIRNILEPSVHRKTRTVMGVNGEPITWNPRINSIMLATNKIDQIDQALLSRLERFDLNYYSDEEVAQILFDALREHRITFSENTLREIAQCNRGTARDIVHWQTAIRQYLAVAKKKTINKDDVKNIIKSRDALPLGVTKNELRTMLVLERCGPMQLKQLAAHNMIDSKEQNSNEKYLFQRTFITVETKRQLTATGKVYLEALRREGYLQCS